MTKLDARAGLQARERWVGVLDLDGFVNAHYAPLLRRAYLLTGARPDAEDLVQEALARTWAAARGRSIESPEAYVQRTMVNLYVSRWRRRRLRREDPVAELPEPVGSLGGARDATGDADERDRLWRALVSLPPRQRAVLVLRYYEDLTEAAAAELLGVTVGTIRSQTWKGLRRLETALRTDDEEGAHRG